MRAALAAHDEVLRSAVEGHGGWLFKHTGDGVCAAFSVAGDAVAAAVVAQRRLGLPVRMGIGTGSAELRGDDYFGPALNRAARVMAAGHGGQILVANSTGGLLSGVDLADLGERRLRDLSGAEHLFQVRAEGLRVEFPPLRTLDSTPGNLAVQSTSFVGREVELKELCALVRAYRLVTLTGVGGVGKTRLAVQVAAELIGEFPDGVWLVELAAVGDPAAVPDVVATALGVTAQAGMSVTAAVAQALAGRRLLMVLDNCEHLLDAAAGLIEAVLARGETVKVVATSREGLRVGAEHVWPVPSLDTGAGLDSAAAKLFVERARAVNPGFMPARESDAVTEICQRLDGIALAIELAAARMVSMTAAEVRDRLGDRFRLLSGSRRGLERHQTLRAAVLWSYDLLDADEQALLKHCSVFADSFDLAAATHIFSAAADLDDYAVLDLLDSLVRKSLVTAEHVAGRTRYGLLETIRQFAEDQLAATGRIEAVRDRHSAYFADQAAAHWAIWNGPRQPETLVWVNTEYSNLRTGFVWAAERGDVACAAGIAAHTVMLGWVPQQLEAVGWVEQILEAASAADIAQLPRLYVAASVMSLMGRSETALDYIQKAVRLEAAPGYDPFEAGFSGHWEAVAHLSGGQLAPWLKIGAAMADKTGFERVVGLDLMVHGLSSAGRFDEAIALVDQTLAAARTQDSPYWIAFALYGSGRAYARSDPARALEFFLQGIDYARAHRNPMSEAFIASDAAPLEAVHGELDRALDRFEDALKSLYNSGQHSSVANTLGSLALFFDRFNKPEVAATIYGACHGYGILSMVIGLPEVVERLRSGLGEQLFAEALATGAAMELSDAVQYARHQIGLARLPRQETLLA